MSRVQSGTAPPPSPSASGPEPAKAGKADSSAPAAGTSSTKPAVPSTTQLDGVDAAPTGPARTAPSTPPPAADPTLTKELEDRMLAAQTGGGKPAAAAKAKSDAAPTAPAPKAHQIDEKFISDREGGRVTEGYVPDQKNSQSGVTIATGFDLGARDVASLKKLGLSDELIKKLEPYLGKKKDDAAAALKAAPLTITAEEAQQIDEASKKSATDSLIKKYDAVSTTKFTDLPPEAQTVIASVAFQYGDLASKTPKFWEAVTKQDWAQADQLLRDFGDKYPSRRKLEADLLKPLLVKTGE
jgi:hypothetical protein